MSASASERFVIPYGTNALHADQVVIRQTEDATRVIECPAPYVVIDSALHQPLRLNGTQYAFPEFPDLLSMTDAIAQLDFLRDHLKQLCDLWAKPPKLFLDCYFEFTIDQIDRNKAPLSESLAQYGGLYMVRDWALSAPRPLPRAQIQVESGVYYPVDFAFWLGGRILAVDLRGAETLTEKERRHRLALQAANIETIEFSTGMLARDGVDYLRHVLPRDFTAFWEGEIMPSSPFKGTSLGEIIRS